MEEIKNKPSGSGRKAGYNSPSVRVIDVKMKTSILAGSYPTEFGDGGNN